MPSERKIDCTLVRCNPEIDENACGLLQMEHSVPSEILYAAYWYRSGTNNTMRNHLKDIVDSVIDTMSTVKHPSVLDIGCNDGTLLGYYPKHYIKYGCDPSDVAQEVKEATVVQDIFPSEELFKILEGKKLDVITSIAMFYDLDNPHLFIEDICRVLDDNGIWVIVCVILTNGSTM